ncbi:hypothetical protein EG329_009831 [Mollisiaceae sp. DMI_Dod_QoI]|nr:hypothetical protein EG329_009831 [Helotiales sp. DMI_Dod_QoI]
MNLLSYVLVLGAAHLGYSNVITTTTVIVDIFPGSTVTIHPTTSTTIHFSLTGSVEAVATPIANSSNANINVTLPSLPLSSDSLTALNSLMYLILSVPDDILQAGDTDVIKFYTNISSCLSNLTHSLESAASNLIPEVASLAHEVGSGIAHGASKATSFLASLTSDIPGALSTAKSIGKSIESEITSAAPALITKASSVFNDATSELGAGVKSLGTDLGLRFMPRGGSGRLLKRKPKQELIDIVPEYINTSDTDTNVSFDSRPRSRSKSNFKLKGRAKPKSRDLSSALSTLTTLSACITAASNSNPLFELGDCAFHLAELVTPASKITKIKDLVEGAGGAVKIVQTLGNAKDAASVARIGGQGVLGALKELLGVSEVVKACKFLV